MENKKSKRDVSAIEEKKKALDQTILQIEKQFGKGSIMTMSGDKVSGIEVIPTGCLALDIALGIGGIPRGRVIEIYGPESSGKTTLALHMIAEAQKASGLAAFIDAEHALDPVYAEKLGVNLDDLYVSQPDNGEQALDIAEQLVKSSTIDIIVIDSVAALSPRAEVEGEMGDAHMGAQARLMSQALRKLTGLINKSKTSVVFINQLRAKMGVSYGSPEVTSGGRALKFYASVRLDVRRIESLKQGTEFIGNRTRIKVVKNKLASPFKQAECDIIFGEGISSIGCVVNLAVENGLIDKAGSWFSYNNQRIGQGRDRVIEFLTENAEIREELEKNIKEKYNL